MQLSPNERICTRQQLSCLAVDVYFMVFYKDNYKHNYLDSCRNILYLKIVSVLELRFVHIKYCMYILRKPRHLFIKGRPILAAFNLFRSFLLSNLP